jgi:hypothetical protein
MERKSGTSFLTPSAVAIAALILEYMNQRNDDCPGGPEEKPAFSEDHRKTLHMYERMLTVLKKIGISLTDGFRYLQSWALWE